MLLLLAGSANILAAPGQNEDARDARQQGQQYENGRDAGNGRNAPRAVQRNEREQNNANSNDRASPRNNSRLTPEERSALRRQIDEAGQDIYSGKYKR